MQPKESRRAVLTATALALSPTAGCLFGGANRGNAEYLTVRIANETTTAQTVTGRLLASDGSTALDRTAEISPDDSVEFRSEDPATEYTLVTEVESGPSRTEGRAVTACSASKLVEIRADRVGSVGSAR